VESVTPSELVVRNADPRAEDAAFDFVVFGLRIGYEEFPVVQYRKMDSRIPSEASYEETYAGQSGELRAFTAKKRFLGMQDGRNGAGHEPVSARARARKLREGIGERDSLVDPPEDAAEAAAAGMAAALVTVSLSSDGDQRQTGGVAAASSTASLSSGGDKRRPGGVASVGALSPSSGTPGNISASSGADLAAVGPPRLRVEDEEAFAAPDPAGGSATHVVSRVRTSEPVQPGDVVVVDPARPGLMSLSRAAADEGVLGVVLAVPDSRTPTEPHREEAPSGSRGEDSPPAVLGATPEVVGPAPGRAGEVQPPSALEARVASSGIVLCKVDASFAPITPGSLLTTSSRPGFAMRAQDPRPGTVLGKALEGLEEGSGTIRIMVTLR
jgi:hypothetical protein